MESSLETWAYSRIRHISIYRKGAKDAKKRNFSLAGERPAREKLRSL
jgi:hypothetical protein